MIAPRTCSCGEAMEWREYQYHRPGEPDLYTVTGVYRCAHCDRPCDGVAGPGRCDACDRMKVKR